ncbi:protein SDE2 [Tripterygium wilfordii]|uniref:Protein SDE2 n=1 Tax=Tripterygium wilfordii TaxID=458696 RepID=A0A7J7CHI8_TRIWF|nr:replication stress response regulator SDE2-like [Tripterygium wilfordii]KAF5733517.1 protein SDE2 [Tripterygium wilfordii]
MEASDRRSIQLFVRLLNGNVRTVQFPSPRVYGDALKQRIFEITRIPIHAQRLVYGNQQVDDTTVISQSDGTVHLLLRLLGGKGGFGSLLRGAATKAGQKKTNNFDACRDMSGRRLRHVNAEKRLEEWKAGEEEKRLEKMAEDFLKKKAKKGKRGAGDREAEKYVEKYREQSAKCVAVVEQSVREACGNGNGKRKGKLIAGGAEAKKLKIWMGKRKLAGSDSDDMDSSDDDENENDKSVVLNNGIHSDSSKEAEDSSDTVTGGKQDRARSGGGSCDSGSEEEEKTVVLQRSESGGCFDMKDITYGENGVVLPDVHGKKAVTIHFSEVADVSDAELAEIGEPKSIACESENLEEADCQTVKVLIAENEEGLQSKTIDAEVYGINDSESGVLEETAVALSTAEQSEQPLNFDEFNSAAEMEALGMERLKSELQDRGLKCGGTLQERAARLFLLKSTPIEKLPKKLLAKK